MSATDKDQASGEFVGSQTELRLYAGQSPIVTEEGVLDTGNLAKYTVVGKLWATGKLVALDPAFDNTEDPGDPEADPPIPPTPAPDPSDGSEVAYGILTQAADASDGDVRVSVYVSGFFNHEALVWPESLDTLAKRQAAFVGTSIRIGSVRL